MLLSGPICAQVEFEDVTTTAGFDYWGESWGASWGDLNGDGWPDIFINHHRAPPSLHVNQGNGQFVDITSSTYWDNPAVVGDMHGGAWADFDNDGDQDFYVTHGSKNPNHFMVNSGGVLNYQTPKYDLLIPSWRGRLPVWFDFTNDGLLDYLVTSENDAPVAEQAPNSFINRTGPAGIDCDKRQMAFLVDVNKDGALDLICTGATFPGRIYDFRLGVPFTRLNGIMPNTGPVQDAAVGDFDGNLNNDFFLVRGSKRLSGANLVNNNSVVAQLITVGGGEKRAHFNSNGDLTITLVVERAFSGSDVAIGAAGWHPDVNVTKVGGERTMVLNLSSSDPNVVGIQPHNPSNNRDVFIGYDPATQRWTITNSPGGLWTYLYVEVSSTSSVSNVTATGINNNDRPIRPVLMSNGAGGFSDVAVASGLGAAIQCVSTVAADFDNDMDMDIYAVCRGANFNLANRYFDNDGTGKFLEVPLAGGAAGPVGAGVGKGENVATADFDVDGNVDLFVTNGLAMNPERIGGPDRLYRNRGHASNNWIQFDLVGALSNRDGIGARVLVTAAGKTQLREQGGGYHRWSQNDRRLHFGLGPNALADVSVEWPSGIVDTYQNVAANSVYRVNEGGQIVEFIAGQGAVPVATLSPSVASNPEASGPVLLSVNLSAAANAPVSVSYQTVAGTATAGEDFGPAAGSVNFAPGQTSKAINIDIVNDAVPEPNESFIVELTGLTGPATLGNSISTLNIQNDDGSFAGIAIGDATADEDSGIISFPVMLTESVVGDVDFTVSTADGSATVVDNDYQALVNAPGTITAGSTATTVSVMLEPDAVIEPNETFSVTLSLQSGNASISDGSAIGTIINDDPDGAAQEVPITDWLNHQGDVATSGNQITFANAAATGWIHQVNSVPLSNLGFDDSYEVRFEIVGDADNSLFVVGLGVDESGPSRTDVDYGFRIANGSLEVRQNGIWITSVGPVSSGDVLSISVISGTLEYRLNNVSVYLSTFTGSPEFYVDSAFKRGSIAINVSVLGDTGNPPPPGGNAIVGWTNPAGGVSATGNTLMFNGVPTGWVNSINSLPMSSLGAGSSFTVNWTIETNPAIANWVVGLGVTESGTARTDVDYGLRNLGGTLHVRENGLWRANAGALAVGDTLGLRVSGTTLEYLLNGVAVFSLPISGTEDFYIDTAFKNGAAQLGAFILLD